MIGVLVFVFSRIIPIALIMAAGVFVESFLFRSREQATLTNRAFNGKVALLYQVSDTIIGGYVAIVFVFIAHSFPNRPLLIHTRPGIGFAILLAFIGNFIADFGTYWWHRLEHYSEWLWPMHELHHSDECMNVTTGSRRHWIESPFLICSQRLLPSLFLPQAATVLLSMYFLDMAQGFFVHLNCPMNLGFLNRIIVTPPVHRIHHSTLPHHCGKNFSATWPIWDIIFGTYAHPVPNEHPPTGLGYIEHNLIDANIRPFRHWWERIKTLAA